MKNEMPKTIIPLGVKAEEMALGADQYGGSLPLVINTAAGIRGDKTSMTEAVNAYEAADRELTNRRATVREATEDGRQWLMLAKDTWKRKLGPRYNEGWDRTGLFSNLSISATEAGVQGQLGSFKEFLTGNADFEAGTVTAAQAGTLLTALVTARGAVQAQATHVRNLKTDRDAKVKTLRTRLSATIKELSIRLTRLDPKWLAFGLNLPGAPTTPQAPLNVTAILLGTSALSVQWEQSAYASYYRIWAKVTDVDQEFVNVGDTDNLEFTVQPLAAAGQVQIAVSAVVNGGGESMKSAVTTVTMPN